MVVVPGCGKQKKEVRPHRSESNSDTPTSAILVKEELAVNLALGASNVSFGLPERETINGVVLAVAIARGLVHRPKLILADEPTAALDEKSGREVVTLFQQYAKEERCTILMVTHDNRILDVADRIVNMVDGRIKSDVLVQESSLICEFLKECPVFAQLTPRTLTEVADKMTLEKHAAAAVIIR